MPKDKGTETQRKKASRQEAGAQGKRDAYMYDPERLVLVTDEKSPLYDERVHLPVNEKLVANMMFQPDGPDSAPLGVIKPVVVRRNPETTDIEVVDGRQRVKAAVEANKRLKKEGRNTIRVTTVTERGRDSRLIGISISANEFNQDETPSGRARKIQNYIDHGHDKKEAANMFGVSEATITNMLAVLGAPKVIRSAADAGKISNADAYKLAKMEPDEAKKKLEELLEKAPRTPGRKRSKNAKKARQVMGRPEAGRAETGRPEPESAPGLALAGGTPEPSSKKSMKKLEDAVAEAIAVWVEANWADGNWNGAPQDIPILIRKGDWREHRDKTAKE
jgi:ParB family chromosome partitioning protein